MIRLVAWLFCCLGMSAGFPAIADDTLAAPPRWSFEIKGGRIVPELPDWKRYYGTDDMNHYVLALGYMPRPALQFGTEIGYSQEKGQGQVPSTGALGGDVSYTLVPVHVYLIFRGVFTTGQWLIPYVGGGWTRAEYTQQVANQQTHEGHADGWNARAGLQVLLNPMDPQSAASFKANFGVNYTYITLDALKFSADINGADLGGISYLLGLRLEF